MPKSVSPVYPIYFHVVIFFFCLDFFLCAIHILGVRSAPLWDSEKHTFVGKQSYSVCLFFFFSRFFEGQGGSFESRLVQVTRDLFNCWALRKLTGVRMIFCPSDLTG